MESCEIYCLKKELEVTLISSALVALFLFVGQQMLTPKPPAEVATNIDDVLV